MSENEPQEIPQKNSTKPIVQVETTNLIQDDQLLGVYGEMLDLARKDRIEAAGILNDFLEMVVNGGDSSSASKEAIVQLLKIKNDAVNTMGKVADLMTRVKLREQNTMPDYLRGKEPDDRKHLIKQLNKEVKKVKRNET